MKTLSFTIILLAVLFNPLLAQKLPVYMTEEEKRDLPNYTPPVGKGIKSAPVSEVRNVAEWEEMDAVAIAIPYYEDFLSEVIDYAQEEAIVYIFVDDSIQTQNYLQNKGIPLTNLVFIEEHVNSVWIRDYGPNNVYTNDVDSLLLIDWVYNRNRPSDDQSPQYLAEKMGVPMYEMTSPPDDLVATGGNFMSDGRGTAFSSLLIMDENETTNQFNDTPKTEEDVDNLAYNYLGIDRYIKMETLPYDAIHHIDMHMKLLDEETLLVGYYPTGIADGPQIDTNLNYVLNNFTSCFGTPYEVVRIPMPPSQGGNWPDDAYYRTYTNSLILNNSVLVPTYYEEYDTTALRIYREAMPGYNVIGINAEDIIPASGTIHCTTHELAAKDPLWISHQRLRDAFANEPSYTVEAIIKHRSDIYEATVYYKNTYNGSYSTVPMQLADDINGIWTADIPQQTPGDSVYYYIQAEANSGKTQVRPMPAPEGNWSFKVLTTVEAIHTIGQTHDNLKVLYPNLTSGYVNFETITQNNGTISLTIKNSLGQNIDVLYHGELPSGRAVFTLPTSELSGGIYFITLESKTGSISKKFLVQ
jgi:agmatine/peptidylarginine deiminase